MNIKANHEYVVLETNAKRAGEEDVSESGIVLGKRTQGEVPEYATVVAVGEGVENKDIKVGSLVPVTNGRMSNVPDPRVVAGEHVPKDQLRQLAVTHWKNITVIYE
ncbi:MAG: hypothetical protein CL489_08980 [Acidobacteria bacterium]|nr:hypothetical protein [Acidobacteriota bacterium]|tara:strand:- start:34176 stop:34493 length:318 start_codon:yes stop_codon:yes gene_type:complete